MVDTICSVIKNIMYCGISYGHVLECNLKYSKRPQNKLVAEQKTVLNSSALAMELLQSFVKPSN